MRIPFRKKKSAATKAATGAGAAPQKMSQPQPAKKAEDAPPAAAAAAPVEGSGAGDTPPQPARPKSVRAQKSQRMLLAAIDKNVQENAEEGEPPVLPKSASMASMASMASTESRKAQDAKDKYHAAADETFASPPADAEVDAFLSEARRCIDVLDEKYGGRAGFQSRGDAVVVMEGWNKALAFRTMFSEALVGKWRIECARQAVQAEYEANEKSTRRLSRWQTAMAGTVEQTSSPVASEEKKESDDGPKSAPVRRQSEKLPEAERAQIIHRRALDLVEFNTDPLAVALGTRLDHLKTLLVAMIDLAVRSLCPHTQRVQREAYRPLNDDLIGGDGGDGGASGTDLRRFALIEGTLEEYGRLFARCGVRPDQWLLFVDAFLWTMKSHNPYADETDGEDLGRPLDECAHAIFAAGFVAKPAIEEAIKLRSELDTPLYKVCVRRFWSRILSGGDAAKAIIGETFYRELLTNHPELLDYFAKADMDSLALHLVMALDLLVKSIEQIGSSGTGFRRVLDHLGEMHRRLSIPTFSFPLVGGQLLKTLRPFLNEEEELTKDLELRSTADELEAAFAVLYMEVMAITYHPMVREEKLVADAEEFFDTVSKELNWSPDQLSRRLLEVKMEISATGTYVHTSEELELGARLCWRNSAKCIGRIAWNTLEVRDMRHVDNAEEIFADVEEHLRIATAGTNIQSVMTVYRPKRPDEAWGPRFWSSQFVRYAGYEIEDEATGKVTVMGDPGNLEFTNYLLRKKLWTPPETRSHFDVLPVVLKLPGVHKPYVVQLPEQCVHQADIEHPTCPAIKSLGLKWAAVPAICNFNMSLGGVDYQCCPFNGWFVSIEVVRNLMERYMVQDRWADAMGLCKTEKMLDMRIQHEVQVAVLHSFEKAGFTMVDPQTVGNSFMVHCKRERDAGRECPGQWSWIGGLVGPTNPTWHREMRDFEVLPQYEYCCEHWLVTDAPNVGSSDSGRVDDDIDVDSLEGEEALDTSVPRVLIVFGSETGTAEAAAARLGRSLRLLKPTVASLNEVAGLDIIKEKKITHLIALCSTFNRGEFPTNAKEFDATDIPSNMLSHTKVAVLAVGSSLYPDFCKAGIALEKKLTKAGGKSLIHLTKANDATGAEAPIADWAALVKRLVMPKHLETRLTSLAGAKTQPEMHEMQWLAQDAGSAAHKDTSEGSIERFQWPEAESAACVGNEELITNGDVDTRSTRKVTFKLPDGVTYETGDHLAVNPLNSLDKVCRFAFCFEEELLEAAGAEYDTKVREEIIMQQLQRPFAVETNDNGDKFPAQLSFKTPAKLGDALQAHIDLTLRPSIVTDLLTMLKARLDRAATVVLDEDNQDRRKKLLQWHRLAVEGSSNMKQKAVDNFLAHFPTMVDFLEEFAPLLCRKSAVSVSQNEAKGEEEALSRIQPLLPLAHVLAFLPRLQARYYSISSSPKGDPTLVSISVGAVHVQTSSKVWIHGVCSNYLARLCPLEDRAMISVRTSSFRGPSSVSDLVIFVGAGTGLAPMMGFLQDRAFAMEGDIGDGAEPGSSHLFFGCRTEEDRIYADQIDSWEERGVLEHHLALSRAPHAPKTYVQDILEQFGERLCHILLDENAHYYICGDAKVADYCFESCVKALRQHGGMSRVAAVQHIKGMRARNRWQYDLWGIISHFNDTKLELKKKKEASAKTWLLSFAD